MAVDLGDLVESLQREISSPGDYDAAFPNSNDDILLGHLQDSFWELWIETDLVADYTEVDGSVTPVDVTDDDLDRGIQQLIVLYAGIRILRNQVMNAKTLFRAKAGPVEYETQQSAQALKGVLDFLVSRRNYILGVLSATGAVTDYYIDAVLGRDDNLGYGGDFWWG